MAETEEASGWPAWIPAALAERAKRGPAPLRLLSAPDPDLVALLVPELVREVDAALRTAGLAIGPQNRGMQRAEVATEMLRASMSAQEAVESLRRRSAEKARECALTAIIAGQSGPEERRG